MTISDSLQDVGKSTCYILYIEGYIDTIAYLYRYIEKKMTHTL